MPATASVLQHPHLQPATVPPGPGRPNRPQLRVLEGGRAPSQLAQQAIYRRRRLVTLVLVLAIVVSVVLLATAALTRFAGGSPSAAGNLPTSAAASSAAGVDAPTVVVRPGDTLWSIAADIAPDADVRITVDELIALNGSSPIAPGQELVLPG